MEADLVDGERLKGTCCPFVVPMDSLCKSSGLLSVKVAHELGAYIGVRSIGGFHELRADALAATESLHSGATCECQPFPRLYGSRFRVW